MRRAGPRHGEGRDDGWSCHASSSGGRGPQDRLRRYRGRRPSVGSRPPEPEGPLRIALTSIFVDDQRAARAFDTDVLGFVVKHEVPVGDDLCLTVVSADDPDGTELLLEPSGHPAG
ncbi:hypothetical protein IGS67_11190 [Flavimobilis sp. GY10621]|uniref:Glyoxalase/fosfomycin resistance/dioxygenase domain-containing protein n=1 Tax=Flavimobilis rhizosphaerae TaxID=2775421 RepID=A0ABR9DSY4_9MICO|nr:VOC family protein [Flavimobilis rhizosphaerae]MBD9700049.1 hypothetical protein [Flavimobilis rhizosphaerae]